MSDVDGSMSSPEKQSDGYFSGFVDVRWLIRSLGLLAIVGWIIALVGSILQKTHADSTISDSYDISAVQVQQLNGSVTNHILVLFVLAAALTALFLIAVGMRASEKLG